MTTMPTTTSAPGRVSQRVTASAHRARLFPDPKPPRTAATSPDHDPERPAARKRRCHGSGSSSAILGNLSPEEPDLLSSVTAPGLSFRDATSSEIADSRVALDEETPSTLEDARDARRPRASERVDDEDLRALGDQPGDQFLAALLRG